MWVGTLPITPGSALTPDVMYLGTELARFSAGLRGARHESDAGLGGLADLCPAFPEILGPAAKFGTAENNDGIGAPHRPVHPGAL